MLRITILLLGELLKALAEHGAELAFTFQGDALKKRVEPLAESLGSSLVIPCDVSSETSVEETFQALKKHWNTLDFVVHAIGFWIKKN